MIKKMKNSKKTQLLTVAFLGIFAFSFVPIVQGYTFKRSLDDWFYYNTGDPMNPHIGPWFSDTLSEPLGLYPHFDINWDLVPIWECEDYTGFVLEREMSDGRHMITVHMRVKGVPVVVEALDLVNPAIIFKGTMNYMFQLKFIIDIRMWAYILVHQVGEDTAFDENGNILLPPQDSIDQEFRLVYN